MSQSVDPKLLSACMRVFANAEPGVYEKFVRILDAYVNDVTVAVTEAPASDILNAQGRAQQARKFFYLFTELPDKPSA